jgi:hypothetical protein
MKNAQTMVTATCNDQNTVAAAGERGAMSIPKNKLGTDRPEAAKTTQAKSSLTDHDDSRVETDVDHDPITAKPTYPPPACPPATKRSLVTPKQPLPLNATVIEYMWKIGDNMIRAHPGWTGWQKSGTYGMHTQGSVQTLIEKLTELGALRRDSLVVDLGAGTNMPCLFAALKTPCKAIGFEHDPLGLSRSADLFLRVAKKENNPKSALYHVGLFEADILQMRSLCGATVCYTYDNAFQPELKLHVHQLFIESDCEWLVSFVKGGASDDYLKVLKEKADAHNVSIIVRDRVPMFMRAKGGQDTAVIVQKTLNADKEGDEEKRNAALEAEKGEEEEQERRIVTREAEEGGEESRVKQFFSLKEEGVIQYYTRLKKEMALKYDKESKRVR